MFRRGRGTAATEPHAARRSRRLRDGNAPAHVINEDRFVDFKNNSYYLLTSLIIKVLYSIIYDYLQKN